MTPFDELNIYHKEGASHELREAESHQQKSEEVGVS
jgi:hypothetical protein